MRKYFLYACLLFAGVFTACDNDDSDGIDPSIPFYQNLGVEYNVTQNHTHIGATKCNGQYAGDLRKIHHFGKSLSADSARRQFICRFY